MAHRIWLFMLRGRCVIAYTGMSRPFEGRTMRPFIPLLAAMTLLPAPVLAQGAGVVDPAVEVFLDCNAGGCDGDHIRNEIDFVNWVRDRTAADVHLLVTSLSTGSGGRQYLLSFVGLSAYAGDSTTLRLVTEQTATEEEERDRLTRRIALGLVRYAAQTASADRIVVEMDEDEDAPSRGAIVAGARDPWNAWVFSIGIDGSINGEERQSDREFQLDLSASRTTADWKLELEAEGDYSRERFRLIRDDQDSVFINKTQDWSIDGFVARSIARLWSIGLAARVGTSTFENQDLAVRVAPAIEYSVFPYSEFSRRQLTVRYSVGANQWDYMERTLYGYMSEQRWDQALDIEMNIRQPWGSAWTSIGGSHYLHDTGRFRLSGFAGLDVRLWRGLSLDISGGYSRVHDQLYVERDDDLTDEEVLLELRSLRTSYEFESNIGLRYTFGSIYNNVVNPRLGGGGW
jgi:hypothetical protein